MELTEQEIREGRMTLAIFEKDDVWEITKLMCHFKDVYEKDKVAWIRYFLPKNPHLFDYQGSAKLQEMIFSRWRRLVRERFGNKFEGEPNYHYSAMIKANVGIDMEQSGLAEAFRALVSAVKWYQTI